MHLDTGNCSFLIFHDTAERGKRVLVLIRMICLDYYWRECFPLTPNGLFYMEEASLE